MPPPLVAVDLSSGGATAALIDAGLRIAATHEIAWDAGAAAPGLSAEAVFAATTSAIRNVAADNVRRSFVPDREFLRPSALVLSSMMHTLLVTGEDGEPRTPVFTWLDGVAVKDPGQIAARFDRQYPERTGAYPHPSFPAYKLAALAAGRSPVLAPPCRAVSLPAWLRFRLTSAWAEDVATASASGLVELRTGQWDPATLDAIGLERAALPPIAGVGAADALSPAAALALGLPAGLPVIVAGGDGFLATRGSGGDDGRFLSVTLGTTAGVRRFVAAPPTALHGAFCYRQAPERFLLGCASSNGGNAIDWARAAFNGGEWTPPREGADLPIFLPFRHGERSPFWDAALQARWEDLSARHTETDLYESVIEGVLFQIAIYVELVARAGGRPEAVVLSGNGFLAPGLAEILAGVMDLPLLRPDAPGAATLRGAARTGWKTLGVSADEAIEALLHHASTVGPTPDSALRRRRYERFKPLYFQFGDGDRIPFRRHL